MKNLLAALALAFVLPALAGAETLYNQDGVRLSATVQKIEPGAAVCRVREARHSAEEYARLKPNDGQALDVWRVELVVANYSGKVLDYLNAHLNVASDWPPCDHWDGPERGYGKPVVWTGPLMSIQEVGSVQPGEERREIEFVLAWHENDPGLGRWDIDYNFAAAGGAAPDAPAADRSAPAASSPPSERTAGGQGAPEPTCVGKEVGSSCWMEIQNSAGCYTWNPNLASNDVTVRWSGECAGGLAQGTGSRIWSYTGSDGNPTSSSGTGELRNGKMNGHWTYRQADGDVGEGPYVDGKRNGHWTIRRSDGDVWEGPYVDGKRNGHWTIRRSDGSVSEGPYVDGKLHGRWTSRYADGTVFEGPFVDSKKNGRWTERHPTTNPEGNTLGEIGGVLEGPYVDGHRNGHWTWRLADGYVWEGPYVDGKRNGHWVLREADGDVDEGPYVDGEKHGHWTSRDADGIWRQGSYVNGERHGRWSYPQWDGEDCYANGNSVPCP